MLWKAFVALLFMLVGICPAQYVQHTRSGGSTGSWANLLGADTQRLELFVFRANEMQLCVVDEGEGEKPRYGSLEAAMQVNRCVAGVNGGYFGSDKRRRPLGLLCCRGVVISPLATGSFTVAGVVYDTGNGIRMERSKNISTPLRGMQEAIQGGPFLVERGQIVPGLEKTKKAARTFIATDGKGTWCIGISSALTLQDLARWLADSSALGGFKVGSALNLDGGSSSAFWESVQGVNRPGFKSVRNYVGVRPRTSRETTPELERH